MRIRPPHYIGAWYHISIRGVAKCALFHDDEDRASFDDFLIQATQAYGSTVHAYCWMTNHVHIVLSVGEQPAFELAKHCFSRYAKWFNRKYERVGHLFQGRHDRRLIDTDAYLKQAVRYVHRNPVEAGIVDDPGAYPWSSYAIYLGLEPVRFVDPEPVLLLFGEQRERARAAMRRFTLSDADEANPWSSWSDLFALSSRRFGVRPEDIRAGMRGHRFSEARLWMAKAAVRAQLGPLPEIARHLGRSPQGLNAQLRADRSVATVEQDL